MMIETILKALTRIKIIVDAPDSRGGKTKISFEVADFWDAKPLNPLKRIHTDAGN